MKKILGLFIIGAFIAVSFAAPSFAGPSRAIIQEMGSTVGAEEVNIDLDWLSQGLNVIAAGDTTVGQPANNGTIGGIGLSSVNIGIAEGYELRLGRLPGIRSYLAYPAGNGRRFSRRLGAWKGARSTSSSLLYGSTSLKDANS